MTSKEALEELSRSLDGRDFENLCIVEEQYEAEKEELEQYKAIEKELGISLITLFKALKNGIYWKGESCFETIGVFNEDKPQLDLENKVLSHIVFRKNFDYVYLKDYGKTWALTKEELE